jgi:hypothetical protein
MSILKAVTYCSRQAAEVEIQAAQIADQHLKAVYLRIAQQWLALARSYEFADSAEHFLLDAKRTKDANSRQPSGELVHLPSSLACREAEQSLKPHSDRCCGTLRLVPDEPPAQSGAVAA